MLKNLKRRMLLFLALFLIMQSLIASVYAEYNMNNNSTRETEKVGRVVTTGPATVIAIENKEEADAVNESEVYTLKASDIEFFDGVITKFVGDISLIGTDVSIPPTINGLEVKTIGEGSFLLKGLTSIELPDGVTTIGEFAFYKNELTNVKIPASVTSIGENAFAVNKLTNVKFFDGAMHIGNFAFSYNELTNVKIPNGIKKISMGAFEENNLTSIEIPSGVTSIGPQAFARNKLTSIKIPNSVKSIGSSAFYLNQLSNVEIPDGVIEIDEDAFSYNKLAGIRIPDSVKYVEFQAFRENPLTYIILNGGATYGVAYYELSGNWGPFVYSMDKLIQITISGEHMAGEKIKKALSPKTDTKIYFEDGSPVKDNDSVEFGETVYLKRHKVSFVMDGGISEDQWIICKIDPTSSTGYSGLATPQSVADVEGKKFIGWDSDDYLKVTSDLTITAQYIENPSNNGGNSSGRGGSSSSEYYTVTFKDYDGTVLGKDRVRDGRSAQAPKKPTRVGYIFSRWSDDYSNVKKDLVIIAQYQEKMNSKAYMIGMPDGTFQPEKNLTRAELVSLLDRFYGLENKYKVNMDYDQYSDDSKNAWYHDSLNRMTQEGLVSGYEDGRFRPERYVTREELVQVIYNHFDIEPCYMREIYSKFYGNIYKDIYNRWSTDALIALQVRGLLQDFSDECFNPSAPISRGETVLLINRYFGYDRGYEGEFIAEFSDIQADSKWSVPIALASKNALIHSTFIKDLEGLTIKNY